MRLMDKVKDFFGKIGNHLVGIKPESGGEVEEYRPSERELHPPVASYTNPNAPLTFAEMKLFVPVEIWNPLHPKHYAVFQLLRNMERFLEESRAISKRPADVYKYYSGKEIQIRCIQEQMAAIRFRLDSCDYENILEMEILKDRLFTLYHTAKKIDPDGVARYERHIDKQMRKARARA